MTVISVEEVEPFIPVTLTDTQRGMVQDLIELVEGELTEILNRPIEIQHFTESHVVNLVEPVLFLENTPVVDVVTVTADGITVPSQLYTVRKFGLDFAGYNTLAAFDPIVFVPSLSHFTWQQQPDVAILATGAYPQSTWVVEYHGGLDGPKIGVVRSLIIRAVRHGVAEFFQGFQGEYISMSVEDYQWRKSERLLLLRQGFFSTTELKMIDHLIHKNYAS